MSVFVCLKSGLLRFSRKFLNFQSHWNAVCLFSVMRCQHNYCDTWVIIFYFEEWVGVDKVACEFGTIFMSVYGFVQDKFFCCSRCSLDRYYCAWSAQILMNTRTYSVSFLLENILIVGSVFLCWNVIFNIQKCLL